MLEINIDVINEEIGIQPLGTLQVFTIPRQGENIKVLMCNRLIVGKVLNVETFAYDPNYTPGPGVAALVTIEQYREISHND